MAHVRGRKWVIEAINIFEAVILDFGRSPLLVPALKNAQAVIQGRVRLLTFIDPSLPGFCYCCYYVLFYHKAIISIAKYK